MGRVQDEEAASFAEKALRLGEREFGPDHPNTAIFFSNLALLYQSLGRSDDVEQQYQRSLAIKEKALGLAHHHVAERDDADRRSG